MKRLIRKLIQNSLRRRGFEIRPTTEFGKIPIADMLKLLGSNQNSKGPVIFDVGANVGEFTRELSERLHNPEIHAFEPGPETFKALQANSTGISRVLLNPFALGAVDGELSFFENGNSEMSSFLPQGQQSWGEIRRTIRVPVRTLDAYCMEKGIQQIDVLKSDTQGYDLEVIRGGERMVREGRINLIYMEINFAAIYEGSPRLDEIYTHLFDRGFRLVTFYGMHYLENRAGWTDAMWAHGTGPILESQEAGKRAEPGVKIP